MNTEDLIETLSQEAASARIHWLSLPSATLLTGVMSAGVMLVFMGLRLDWSSWQAGFGLAMKLLLAATVLSMALYRLRSAVRPEVSLKGSLRAFAVPMAALLVLALGSLIIRSPSTWEAAIRGETLLICLTAIPLLSLPTLAGTLWVLRKGAVSDAFRCGLLAGLLAGAVAVLIYSMYCTEDDPAFYGLWYTVGVSVSMLIGGLIGKRVLRW